MCRANFKMITKIGNNVSRHADHSLDYSYMQARVCLTQHATSTTMGSPAFYIPFRSMCLLCCSSCFDWFCTERCGRACPGKPRWRALSRSLRAPLVHFCRAQNRQTCVASGVASRSLPWASRMRMRSAVCASHVCLVRLHSYLRREVGWRGEGMLLWMLLQLSLHNTYCSTATPQPKPYPWCLDGMR